MYFSKSKYTSFRQCPKIVWLDKYKPEEKEIDESAQERMASGALYFSLSRRLSFPGISSSYRFFKQMKKLNKVLSNQPKSVFSSHFYGRFDITRLNS